AADISLIAGHEGQEILLKGAEPQSIIDYVRIFLRHESLETLRGLAEHQRLQLIMSAVKDDPGRSLVQLPRLDAHQAILHMIDAADAMFAAQFIEPLDQAHAIGTFSI